MFELLSHITKTIIARPGMSFVNEDQKKNVFQVIKQLEWRQQQFVIWHEDISNSISASSTGNGILSRSRVCCGTQKIARINVAFADLTRTDAMASIEDNFQDFDFKPFIKVRPLQSRYFEYLLAQDIYICIMR